MPEKLQGLKIPKRQGEKTLALTRKLKLVNEEFEIQRDDRFLLIPLIATPLEDFLMTLRQQGVNCEVITSPFERKKKEQRSISEVLAETLPPNLLPRLSHSMDVVGDIAIIEIPKELEPYKKAVGGAILKSKRNIHTVLAKAGPVKGTHRLRKFSHLAGEQKTETVHREFGCTYHVDVARAYFSPRLSHEHKRVASLVEKGETVADLFAGVGPFSILIARSLENVSVYAVDANQYAVKYLKTNIRVNRVIDKVYAFLGDARQIVDRNIQGIADRVIMNLPEKSINFVDVACHALKPRGGILHFYCFVDSSNSRETMIHRLAEAVKKSGRQVERILSIRMVRETAPYAWQAVLDARVN